jgi:hypothetical protein
LPLFNSPKSEVRRTSDLLFGCHLAFGRHSVVIRFASFGCH